MTANPQPLTPSIFIATPCYGGVLTDAYFQSTMAMVEFLNKANIPSTVRTLAGRSRIAYARNTLVGLFLKTDCTHLAFIDADMEFPPHALKHLLAHDRDIVAATYTKKKRPVEWCHSALSEKPDEAGLVEVRYAGTGFILIRRSVFDHIAAANAVPVYKDREIGGPARAFFMETLQSGFLVSEDYSFCLLWRALGKRVWVDPELRLGHVGSTVYRE